MKLKNTLALLLTFAMLLALAACGGGGGNVGGSSGNSGSGGVADAGNGGGANGPISLTLWGGEEDQSLLAERVEAFKAA